jgi:ABC-type uncharacterized transport system involved in gliding motility auxiliary subunit
MTKRPSVLSEETQAPQMSFVSRLFLIIALVSILGAAMAVMFVPNYGPWAYGFMGLTALFFILWILTAYPQVKSYVGRRSTRLGANTLAVVLVTLGILVGVNFVAVQNEVEKDLTREGLYSLSEQTLKFLSNLDQEVKVTTFLSADVAPVVKDALERYTVFNKKLKINHVDIEGHPEIVRAYNVKRRNVLVFEAMTRESRVESLNVDKLEEQITNALIQVSKEGTQNICFLTGHGEWDLASMEASGMGSFKESLKNSRYEGKEISLLEVEQVPSDCAALIVAGPKKALFDSEKKSLTDFITKGGKTALMLDPYIDSSWAEFVSAWGVESSDRIVVEYNPIAQAFGGSPIVPTLTEFDTTVPFVADFKGQMAMSEVRPVKAGSKVPEGLTIKSVAKTTANSWEESDDVRKVQALKYNAGQDVLGPVSVAVHVTGKLGAETDKDVRDIDLVVFGDSDFLNNDLSRYVNNLDMGLNLVAYFVQDTDLVSIRPKDKKSDPLDLSNQDMRVLFGFTIILLPFLFFFAAGTVYLRRRSR